MDLPNPNVNNPKVDLLESDVVLRSASALPPPPERKLASVAKLIDVSKCIGCKACQSACLEWNDKRAEVGVNSGSYENPDDLTPNMFTLMRFTEWVNPETQHLEWLIRKDGCMHCEDPGCLKACPAPGAIVQYSNGIVDFVHENCIGCGYCIRGCPFNIPRISRVDHTAYKCTLCSERLAVGQGPACAKACPTQAIVFGTKDDMKQWADGRIKDLKSRGYKNAGLYDPPGVGGTHVMYVLHHADRPQLYAGLPDKPPISPSVDVWQRVIKPVALAGIAFTAIAGFFHWVVAGPNEVEAKDETEADHLRQHADKPQ